MTRALDYTRFPPADGSQCCTPSSIPDSFVAQRLLTSLLGTPQGRHQMISRLVLIWLTQQTPMGSVKGCPDRHSLRPCGSFKENSPPRKPASNTSRSAAGQRATSVPVAEIGGLMIW